MLLYFHALACCGQVLPLEDIFSISSLSTTRLDNYLGRSGFTFAGRDIKNDTLLRMYTNRRRGFNDSGFISRGVTRADIRDESFITFTTASAAEFIALKAQLKNGGFYCNRQQSDTGLSPAMYQRKDRSVRTFLIYEDGTVAYALQFHKKIFPRSKDIYYANDLLTFTSHEFLVSYFGEKNVKKDNYFFAGDQITRCSVLFSNTSRQVVFIWSDEENQCGISSLLVGGQQNLKSSLESEKYVEQNNWALKSGVRPGMSLQQLRILNGNDFRFYGGNSNNSGSVIPDSQGRLDFKREEIILGCLNCSDDKYARAKVVNADDSIEEGWILFVLSIILSPS